ncbi:MlaD family protein [Roseococcus sp. YIM B11640]|uniref:MlaD family protein n=1 Tax=Roseococcus sp. YIM B11640 TaxID=3133973 RepID=UPI003C7AD9B5
MARSRRVYLSVGIMVLVAMALVLAFVLFLTQNRLRTTDSVMETYLRESVQGLEVGAPVRYRGVAVGRVTSIGLASAEYRRPEGEPFAGAFQLVVVRFAVNLAVVGDIPEAENAVELGLRARLASQGITGVSYIELDFVDPDRNIPPRVPWTPRYKFIPAVPSTVAQVTSAAENIMRQLQDIDFAALFGNLSGLVSTLRDQAQGLELQQAVNEATGLLADLRRVVAEANLPAVAEDVRGTSASFRALAQSPDIQRVLDGLATAAQDLRRSTAQLPGTLRQIESGVRGARSVTGDFQADLIPILRDLRATAANLRDTTEALRRSPSQAILGAPPPAGAPR